MANHLIFCKSIFIFNLFLIFKVVEIQMGTCKFLQLKMLHEDQRCTQSIIENTLVKFGR